jgi:3-oxoacyl-[acyl-carrier-protein] synthase-3
LPTRVVSNDEIGRSIGQSADWIFRRTGIRERRVAGSDEHTSELAARAAVDALRHVQMDASDLDLIIVATNTPDMMFPSTACLTQAKLQAKRAAAFDVKAAGAGFLYALEVGAQFIASHTFERVLVIGAEKLSSVVGLDGTAMLFGDGAGAVVLRPGSGSGQLIWSELGGDASHADLLWIPAGGSRIPASDDSIGKRLHSLRMIGPKSFKPSVAAMCHAAKLVLNKCRLSVSDIDCIIPHQSNQRIIDAFRRKIGTSVDQVFVNIERCGNTSAASIPIALGEAVAAARIQTGDLLLLVAFGGGLVWGATLIQW